LIQQAGSSLSEIRTQMNLQSDVLAQRLAQAGYLADRGLATALALCVSLGRALLLEGEAGVGKTEAARALACAMDAELIRLQCYEGIDVHSAVYDWNYPRQLLAIRRAEAVGDSVPDLYGREFLIRRPLLAALEGTSARPVVLLIDEIDRADDEFEAFLLEYLADFAITIPELGRIAARTPPTVILTSNRTRDLHDALKRRCHYHWIDHPSLEREIEIVRARVAGAGERLARDVASTTAALRRLELRKPPGVAEAIDCARAALALGAATLDRPTLEALLGTLLKYPEDLLTVRARLDELAA
jgi:MoxR-like ATPase